MAAASSVWQVQLLGGFQVRHGDRLISRFKTYKTAALLARLALFAGRGHSREELAALLWPDAEPEAGRGSLRTALAGLRRQLADPGGRDPDAATPLEADRLQVRLRPGSVRVDVAEFEAAVAAAERATGPERAVRLAEALGLYRGELLPGSHEEWVQSERERLSLLYRATLRRLILAWEEGGESAQALEAAQRALSLFPAEEDIHRELIGLYARMGRADEARCQYQALERALREEGSGPPSEATRALFAALPPEDRNAQMPVPSPAPAASPRFAPLPSPLTRFFGRGDELGRLGDWLRRPGVRLVTLTGPGGAGKTRLALETARRLSGFFPGGVLFVGLASLSDGEGIVDALADALRLRLQADPSPVEQVAAALGGPPALLILDNLEQIADLAGPPVEGLLTRVPGLTCLVTSRQRLDIPGEREFPLPPLPVPPARAASLADFPSVQLFVDRAQAGLPDFQITPDNAPAVAALCERLEGSPLALELAAGWAQTLTPGQMLDRMGDRFSLLVSRRQGVPPRHRTLRDAIAWSCRLLSPEQRRFFVRLSVFRGGWSLEAAQAVCEEPGALALLSQLRARSLLVTAEEGGVMRFRMLESLREFAEDQETEERWAGDQEARADLARRHARYFLRFAREAQEAFGGPDEGRRLDRLEAEHANLRAALGWFLAEPDGAEAGIQMVALLGRFWYMRGHWREQRQVLEALLARPGVGAAARAAALYQLGDAARYLGDRPASQEAYGQSLALCERLGDRAGAARCLRSLGQLAHDRGDYQAGRLFFERCLSLRRDIGDAHDIADALQNLGRLVQAQGDAGAARALYAESLALARQAGDEAGVASVLTELAMDAAREGRHDEARALLEERLVILRRLEGWSGIANTLVNLSRLAQTQGETARALSLVEEGLSVYRALGYQEALADALEHRGVVARSRGDHARAEAALQECQEIRLRLVGITPEALELSA